MQQALLAAMFGISVVASGCAPPSPTPAPSDSPGAAVPARPAGPDAGNRFGYGVARIGRWIYAPGGMTGREHSRTTERLDPDSDKWEVCPSLSVGRVFHAVAASGGELFVFGGIGDDSDCLDSVERLDPKADSWKTGTAMTTPRNRVGAAAIAGLIYVVGGMDAKGNTGALEVYDPASDSWAAAPAMPTARHGHGVVAHAGVLYAIGGYSNDGQCSVVEAYDPKQKAWIALAPMPAPNGFFGAAVFDAKLYTLCGRTRSLWRTAIYDCSTDRWTQRARAPSRLNRCAAVAAGDRILLLGGEEARGGDAVRSYWPRADSWVRPSGD